MRPELPPIAWTSWTREVVPGRERQTLLLSGSRACPRRPSAPGGFPFPLMDVDTNHNLAEALEFRDRRMAEFDEPLVVGIMPDLEAKL